MNSPFEIAEAWQQAANRQDVERLLVLSDPNIEVIGPRGSGFGHQLLRDWLGRAGLTLTTLRAFGHVNTVVLAQHALWRSADAGASANERDLASRFDIEGGRVVRFARYDSVAEALVAAGLSEANALA